MKLLSPVLLVLFLAAPALAQLPPPAVIGPVQEPETRKLQDVPPMTAPRQLPPEEIYPADQVGRPSVSEFVRSLTAPCDPERKPGDPAEPDAAPACRPPPNDVFIIRPPFSPPKPDLHPDYGKLKRYPLTPL
jgi:hypothetical protein